MYKFTPHGKYFYVKYFANPISSFVINGITAKLGQSVQNDSVNLGTVNTNFSLISGGVIAGASNIGNTAYASLSTSSSAAAFNTDYNGSNVAAASGVLTKASYQAGAVKSFDINVSSYTAGSSTGLLLILQWSPDNGTTWYDLWHCEPITSSQHVYIPAIPIPGLHRFKWATVNNTAATTAVVSITEAALSYSAPKIVQYFDFTANLLNGTLGSVSNSFDISGIKTINAKINLGSATVAASYQFQLSDDNIYWASVGTPVYGTPNAMVNLIATNISSRFCRLVVNSAGSSQSGIYISLSGAQ
jgi:hypothetical protein